MLFYPLIKRVNNVEAISIILLAVQAMENYEENIEAGGFEFHGMRLLQ